MSGPPPFDMHRLEAGALARNTPAEEGLRRRKAEKLGRQYRRDGHVFKNTTVPITHDEVRPPRFTKDQWHEEYDNLLEYLDEDGRKHVEKDMHPQVVRTTQHVVTPIEFGVVDRIAFRGDTRPLSLIFSTGFARKDINEEVTLGSEKTYGGISTSTSAEIVRRKYGNCGEYIYACWIGRGIDTHDFNGLDEVISLHIEPENIIGGAGPIYKLSNDKWFHLGVREVKESPACRVRTEDRVAAMKALNAMCHIIASPKTKSGAWEV